MYEKILFSYKIIDNVKFLIASLKTEQDKIESIRIKLKQECIANTLPVSSIYDEKENKLKILYDISNKATLSEMIESKEITNESLLTVIEDIVKTSKDNDSLNSIVLDSDYIFMDIITLETYFTYIPDFNNRDLNVDVIRKYLLNLISVCSDKIKNNETMKLLFETLKFEELDTEKVLNIIKDSAKESISQDNKPEKGLYTVQLFTQPKKEEIKPKPKIEVPKDEEKKPSYWQKYMWFILAIIEIIAGCLYFCIKYFYGKKINIISIIAFAVGVIAVNLITYLIKKYSNTKQKNNLKESRRNAVTTKNNIKKSVYLEYIDDNRKCRIKINKDSILIGKLQDKVDYVINNKKISKVHAEFIIKDGKYFVKDCNSTNGIYINDSKNRIITNTEYEIFIGDKIKLANVELTLKI